MNKERRSTLMNAMAKLSDADDIVKDVCRDEEYAMENVPENLQGSAMYDRMVDVVDFLGEAIDSIGEAIGSIEHAIDESS